MSPVYDWAPPNPHNTLEGDFFIYAFTNSNIPWIKSIEAIYLSVKMRGDFLSVQSNINSPKGTFCLFVLELEADKNTKKHTDLKDI